MTKAKCLTTKDLHEEKLLIFGLHSQEKHLSSLTIFVQEKEIDNMRSATSQGRHPMDHVRGIIMGLALLRVSFLPG